MVSELRLPPDEQALLGREWWPSYAHAVVHPDGVFLFDNGAGIGNAEIEATFSPRVRPIEDALGEHGISLADVTAAANCLWGAFIGLRRVTCEFSRAQRTLGADTNGH